MEGVTNMHPWTVNLFQGKLGGSIKTRPGDLVMPDPFGHFWFDFGPYWTNLDIFGPFCLL